ncbi:phage tail protein [Pseudoalteromonas sp. J010]|uniref:phage tail-collar fiber domain-containing protein n=1 Tax=Pseudoalteromonas sp. J010 TaxID=998465 RepID=UPI000F652EAE|nr:phage tail protein [Pseudoalteromonas sp. J010]RRS07641.1 phage tail protein [Pseudoalteromonas sp. J010]
MEHFTPLITQAGLNAAVNAKANGFTIDISAIAVGTAGYTPSRSQTQLQQEKNRVVIAGGQVVGDGQFHLTGHFQDDEEYAVREVGFYLADGTLFAVWSHPQNVLFYQTPIAQIIQGFDLLLSAVPAEAITINTTGDLRLFYAAEFLDMLVAQTQQINAHIQANHRQIQFNDRLLQLGV